MGLQVATCMGIKSLSGKASLPERWVPFEKEVIRWQMT